MRDAGVERAADDVGGVADRGVPVRRRAAPRLIGLRQRKRGDTEDGALDGTGDRAGINYVLARIAVTPLRLDMTDEPFMTKLAELFDK